MSKPTVHFSSPVPVPVLEDEFVQARNFREYAALMQLPDPTFVKMSDDVSDLMTQLINDGLVSPFDALHLGSCGKVQDGECLELPFTDYQYNEIGREYVPFPSLEDMKTLLRWKYPKAEIN